MTDAQTTYLLYTHSRCLHILITGFGRGGEITLHVEMAQLAFVGDAR